MNIFSLDNPFMNLMGKVADLIWLNILALFCCIPLVTAGASLTALHYMALKIVRNEECYITKGFFKSFKENFKQATIIWLLILLLLLVLVGDFYIIFQSGIEFHMIFKVVLMVAAVLVVFTMTFVFPVLAKFENNIKRTIRNAFVMSILQFPKTILMILINLLPLVLCVISLQMVPIAVFCGLSVPACLSAMLYNKFFQKLEDQIIAANPPAEEEDERIFKDELEI